MEKKFGYTFKPLTAEYFDTILDLETFDLEMEY